MTLSLGLDLGTSGLRSAVVDASGAVLAQARAAYPGDASSDAEVWWAGALDCLRSQIECLRTAGYDPSEITRIAVDGTSGSVVLTDANLRPVTRTLMYNDGGFSDEAALIAKFAPDPHITRGPASALSRVLRLRSEAANGVVKHLMHQADFIAARLSGVGGVSDQNNSLKTGFDPESGTWPDWFAPMGLNRSLLPKVLPAGTAFAEVRTDLADQLGLSPHATVHTGTTDSIAAFLAASPLERGAAVTSLGTTLAIKILSEERFDAPEIGLYSHKIGDFWLVGGASNTGGGVLAHFFSPGQMKSLSARIDPSVPSELDYYPLLNPGERFPINDPNYPPRMEPRPSDDAAFFGGLLEGIARIEAQCYAAIQAGGGPVPKTIFTAGGGAQNPVFTAIRSRVIGAPIESAATTEAAIGVAKLANL